jgi:EmrB/QacA subfamily drug resistance transporter
MTKQQRLVLVISILASFVAFLDGSVINVGLPAITRELGGGLATQQWVVDAYLITLGAFMLIAGSFSDLFGRKRVLLVGLLGFAAASALCAVAPSGLFLIISRAVQGLAGALLVPSSLALIISSFSGPLQGKAIGTWTAWTGIAFIIGPLLGGFLIDVSSWRFIFAINVLPIALTIGLMRLLTIVEQTRTKVRVDVRGAVLCAIGLGGPVYAFIEQAQYGWLSPVVYGPLGVGAVALIFFVLHERRTPEPMLPLSLFGVRNFSVGNIATVAIYGGLSLATFLVTVFIQQTGGFSATQAGLALLPPTILLFLLSSRFGALAGTYGPRFFMAAGPILAGLGFLYLLRVDVPVAYWTQLFPGIFLFGLGLAVTVAPLTSAILGSINGSQAGIASAVNNAVARIAGLLAIAGVGVVTGPTLNLAGFHKGVVLTAFLLVAGGVISAFGIRNLPHQTD